MTANLTLTYGALNLTATPYLIEFGADFGAPENVTQVLALLFSDGEIEMTDRTSNRTIQFNVLIEGANLAALAQYEAALMAEANKGLNTLTVDPGDSGPATVYETFRAQVSWLRDDDMDQQRIRRYSVTIKAMPAGRSTAEVVAAALSASGSTTTLVDNGSATTNWTGAVNGVVTAPAVTSGAVGITTAAVAGDVTISLTRTAAITTSTTKYLVVDWMPASAAAQSPTLRAFADGVEQVQVARAPSPTAGFTRSWFGPVAASSIAVLRLDGRSSSSGQAGAALTSEVRSLLIDNIDRTDVKPTLGSGRQLLRSVDVAGSTRTNGSLAVEHATSALGDVLVYTFPDTAPDGSVTTGYSPPLRPYRVAGGATVTTGTSWEVSGASDNIKGATSTFDVPFARLLRGPHIFMIRASPSLAGTVTFNWTMQARLNSVSIGPTESGTRTVAMGLPAILTLDRVNLPTLDVNPATNSAVMRVTITASGTPPSIALDEAWLFNTTVGNLLGPVACGTSAPTSGGSANRLYIEPATVAVPRPLLRIGFAADRSDSFYPQDTGGWQLAEFVPPRVNVLTVTTNALDASVTLRHFPRWDLNAAS